LRYWGPLPMPPKVRKWSPVFNNGFHIEDKANEGTVPLIAAAAAFRWRPSSADCRRFVLENFLAAAETSSSLGVSKHSRYVVYVITRQPNTMHTYAEQNTNLARRGDIRNTYMCLCAHLTSSRTGIRLPKPGRYLKA